MDFPLGGVRFESQLSSLAKQTLFLRGGPSNALRARRSVSFDWRVLLGTLVLTAALGLFSRFRPR